MGISSCAYRTPHGLSGKASAPVLRRFKLGCLLSTLALRLLLMFWRSLLLNIQFTNIFSQSIAFNFDEVQSIFLFHETCFWWFPRTLLLTPGHDNFLLFYSQSFIVLCFTFRSVIHFEFISVWGLEGNLFSLQKVDPWFQRHLLKRPSWLHGVALAPVRACVLCSVLSTVLSVYLLPIPQGLISRLLQLPHFKNTLFQ